MMRVTIGVPVYNGAAQIAECLDCLTGQTARDIRILISDNASTDGTSEICARYAAAHPNVEHHRHPQTADATTNFLWLLDRARDDLFMWRAHDDLSSPDYVERLAALFEDPRCRLAVGAVETIRTRPDGSERVRRRGLPGYLDDTRGFRATRSRMLDAHQSWFYGLWHRQTLVDTFGRVWADYPDGWGSDHLTLLPLLFDRAIRGDAEAVFIQRIGRTRGPAHDDLAEMAARRRTVAGLVKAQIASADLTPVERITANALLPRWLDKRIHSRSRLLGMRLRGR